MALALIRLARPSICDCTSYVRAPRQDAAAAGENAELRRQLQAALEQVARLETKLSVPCGGAGAGIHDGQINSGGGNHWWLRLGTRLASHGADDASKRPMTRGDTICTNAVVERSAALKIAQLRAQLGEERDTPVPCAKKEVEEIEVKTIRFRQILAQVSAASPKCAGAVNAERDYWQQRVLRLITSALMSEAGRGSPAHWHRRMRVHPRALTVIFAVMWESEKRCWAP